MIRETAAGVELDVRVIPRARKTEMAGLRGDALLVRLAAPPVEGAANDLLVEFLASQLHLPRRAVRIVGGEHTRRKRVVIAGATAETIGRALAVQVRPVI